MTFKGPFWHKPFCDSTKSPPPSTHRHSSEAMPEGLYQPLIAALKYKGFDSTKLCMFSYLLSSYHPTCSYLRQHSHTSSDQVKTRGRRKESLFFSQIWTSLTIKLTSIAQPTVKPRCPRTAKQAEARDCRAAAVNTGQSISDWERDRDQTGQEQLGHACRWHTLQVGFHISLCLQGLFLRSLLGRPCAALDLADVLQTDRYLLFKLKYCLNRPYPPRGPHPRLSPFSERWVFSITVLKPLLNSCYDLHPSLGPAQGRPPQQQQGCTIHTPSCQPGRRDCRRATGFPHGREPQLSEENTPLSSNFRTIRLERPLRSSSHGGRCIQFPHTEPAVSKHRQEHEPESFKIQDSKTINVTLGIIFEAKATGVLDVPTKPLIMWGEQRTTLTSYIPGARRKHQLHNSTHCSLQQAKIHALCSLFSSAAST